MTRRAASHTLLLLCFSLLALFVSFLILCTLVGLAERDVIFVAH